MAILEDDESRPVLPRMPDDVVTGLRLADWSVWSALLALKAASAWSIDAPDLVDPNKPDTVKLDAALSAAEEGLLAVRAHLADAEEAIRGIRGGGPWSIDGWMDALHPPGSPEGRR